MIKGCLWCANRLNDGVESAHKDGVDTYYTCKYLTQKENGGRVRVRLEHKTCSGFEPNPFYYMNWEQVKRIVETADNPKLLQIAEAQGWSQEEYYTAVLNAVKLTNEYK